MIPGWHRRRPLCAVRVLDATVPRWRQYRPAACGGRVVAYDADFSPPMGACAQHLADALDAEPERRWVWAHDTGQLVARDPLVLERELVLTVLG